MQEKLYVIQTFLFRFREISAPFRSALRFVSSLEDFMRNFCATFDISTKNDFVTVLYGGWNESIALKYRSYNYTKIIPTFTRGIRSTTINVKYTYFTTLKICFKQSLWLKMFNIWGNRFADLLRINSPVIKSTTAEMQSSSRRRILHDRLTRYSDWYKRRWIPVNQNVRRIRSSRYEPGLLVTGSTVKVGQSEYWLCARLP